MKEKGEVDAWLLLCLVVVLQLLAWRILRNLAAVTEDAYGRLEEQSRQSESAAERKLEFFGETWDAPAPRIDYGAYYQRERDADALCYIVRCCLSEADAKLYRCD